MANYWFVLSSLTEQRDMSSHVSQLNDHVDGHMEDGVDTGDANVDALNTNISHNESTNLDYFTPDDSLKQTDHDHHDHQLPLTNTSVDRIKGFQRPTIIFNVKLLIKCS